MVFPPDDQEIGETSFWCLSVQISPIDLFFSSNIQLMAAPRCDPWHHGLYHDPSPFSQPDTGQEQIIQNQDRANNQLLFPLFPNEELQTCLCQESAVRAKVVLKKPNSKWFAGIMRFPEGTDGLFREGRWIGNFITSGKENSTTYTQSYG